MTGRSGSSQLSGYEGFAPMTEMPRESVTGKLRQRIADLERAIVEHRTAIRNAGRVRVDSRDVPRAQAKQRADERLWKAVNR